MVVFPVFSEVTEVYVLIHQKEQWNNTPSTVMSLHIELICWLLYYSINDGLAGNKILESYFFFPPSGKESMFSCFLFIACIPFILFYLISQSILQGSIILQFISWLVIMAQFYLAVPLPYTDSYFFFLIQEHFFEACLWIFLLSIISVAIFEGPTFNSLACLP